MNPLENNKNLYASAAPPGGRASAGAREIRIVSFPKEFHKNYWASFDKKILVIWFASLVIVYTPLLYMAAQPKPPVSTVISDRLLKKIGVINKIDPKLLEEIDKPKEEEKTETSTATGPATVIKAPTGNVGKAGRAAAAKAAAAARAGKAAGKAAGKGVLAVAGASGTGSSGKYASVDFSGSSSGLDDVLGQIGGLGEAGGSGSDRTVLGAGGGVGGEGGLGDLTALLGDPGGLSVSAGESGGGLIGVGKASIAGGAGAGASAGEIQSVIDANAAAVNSCYQKELKKSPDLKGKLSVAIKVNQAGRVAGVNVTQNTVGNAVSSCVTNKIRGWSFPKGKKGVITINQTFVFTK
ncbi:AgmX/PglI C-terminal domain-containing protein [bacterium]|nr:AgmX/PglI C-terminal domain-containing protein [bacterium]